MIPRDYITEWRQHAPWILDTQVEQDLVISRALVEIFKNEELRNTFAFRGGTALSKLYFPKVSRYSEDIDLVQMKAGAIGSKLTLIQSILNPWLGSPQRNQKEGTTNLIYRFQAEGSSTPLRLKVEINSREHFAVFGFKNMKFSVDSRWHSGTALIPTYTLNELMGTKLRALYQRRKGRDLFDLWVALTMAKLSPKKVVEAFHAYLKHQKLKISKDDFQKNLALKMRNRVFLDDVNGLILPSISYDPVVASTIVQERLIQLI